MFSLMSKLKSLAVVLTMFSFVVAISVTSCTTKEKTDAVESAEGGDSEEHPAESTEASSEEHPEASSGATEEHPSDSTATSEEHPTDSDSEEEHPSDEEEESGE